MFFSCYECNNNFTITHGCSNYSISRIKSTTLANSPDLEHCAAWAVFPYIWKQRYYLRMEVVSDLTYEFCYFLDIVVNQIPTNSGYLVQWHCGFFRWGGSKYCKSSYPNKIWELGAVTLWFLIMGVSNNLASS